ncbi:MAG: septum formation initiator family protein [Gemmatimonadota bacterium]|jgi:cell division protein FtsB
MAKVKRLVLPTLLGLAAYYALFGGEYSLLELRKARREIEAQEAELSLLRAEVEHLRARADSLENDPVMLERIARERFGMIRDGEVLYRFTEPQDSAGDTLQ